MTHIAGTLTRRLAPLLGLALVVAALGCREDAESPTAPEPGAALEITPAHVLAFRQVSGGLAYTCGVTTSNQAYCWGNNADGQLGDGTFTQRLTPVPVAGGLQFRQVNTGGIALRSAIPSDRISPAHTCGVTTGNQAYCWGNNEFGQLGDGTSRTTRLAPVAVAGGLLFRQIHPGGLHACGITTSNQAYCWGHNSSGELGDGTGTDRLTPVAVAGGLQFRQVSAGGAHTCGVTMDNRGFCWGANGLGQLGLVGGADRLTPVPVAGGLRFRQVSAGFGHTCGVTTSDVAFCWGNNVNGELGDGTTTTRFTPVAVSGGRRFRRVSAGRDHTCAVNPFDRVFCWGSNIRAQLGDGTTTQRLTPVRVIGGVRFRQVSASKFRHTCGVTPDNLAYCWGRNDSGELGDGTLRNRRKPNPVAGAT